MNFPIIRLKETYSTNQYLIDNVKERNLSEGCVVMADYQTGGRGQAGNSWESERGKNLTFSLLLSPECIPANEAFIISQIVSLSIKDTLCRYVDGNVSIKWPNDIYIDDKKVCGILIENSITGDLLSSSVIGVGLNLNQTVFLSNAPNPVSLSMITGRGYEREEVLNRILSSIFQYYLMVFEEKTGEIRAAYRNALYRKDGFFDYRDAKGIFKALIAGVEPSGMLVLELQDRSQRRYAFKEVSFVV